MDTDTDIEGDTLIEEINLDDDDGRKMKVQVVLLPMSTTFFTTNCSIPTMLDHLYLVLIAY